MNTRTMFRKSHRRLGRRVGSNRDLPSNILAGAAIVGLVGAMGAWATLGLRADRDSARDDRLCLLHSTPPKSILVLLDETDTLARDSGLRFTRLMDGVQRALPKNGRLTVVPFGGDVGKAPVASYDTCSPGRGSEAGDFEGSAPAQRLYEQRFQEPLAEVSRSLAQARTSTTSPIALQIERAVTDPAIDWTGGGRELVVFTDGLENTATSRIYTGGPIALPTATPGMLAGVTVRYVELTNAKQSARQAREVRTAWFNWFRAAGASKVIIHAPGFAQPR